MILMKKQRLVRVFLMAAVALLVSASTAMALIPGYTISYPLGEGTTYYAMDGENSSGSQKVNYIEYQPNSDITPIIAYGKGLYGKSTIDYMTQYVESLGKEVVAGINADFFDTTTGIPIGLVIQDGVLISSNDGQYAVGFKEDGSAVIGKPIISMVLSGLAGNVTVDSFNKTRSQSVVCLLDNNFSSETRITSAGTNIVLERIDDTPVTVNGSIALQVVSKESCSTSKPIGDNQMVLTVSANGPVSRIPDYQVGDTVVLTTTAASDQWEDVLFAVGGKCLLTDGVVNTTGNPTGTNPRSAVGIKADGTVVFYEVDGRQSSFSIGMTPAQLAEELQDLGCVSAINLDGGGSSAMTVQYPGDSDPTVVNRPSDGNLRACANYIMLINNNEATGKATSLYIYPESKYALPGAAIVFTVKAVDKNYYPATLPKDISYEVLNKMGMVSGDQFIAGNKTGNATIEATASNGLSGSHSIFILGTVDTIAVKQGTANVTSLSLSAGQSVDLNAAVSYKNLAIASQDSLLTWKVTGDIGSITKEGVFTADAGMGSGSITVSYNGCETTIPVSVSLGIAQGYSILADFEETQGFDADEGATLSLVSRFDLVHNGYQALKVDYVFEEGDSISLPFAVEDSVSGYTRLALWVLGDGSDTGLTAHFKDQYGMPVTVPFTAALSGVVYQYLTAAIPDGAQFFAGLSLEKGSLDQGAFYIDQLLLSSSSLADTTPPVISFVSSPSVLEENATVTLTAKVTDDGGKYSVEADHISVFVDGQSIDFTNNKTTGAIAFTTPQMSCGVHRITVLAADQSGNLARKSLDMQAGATETTPVFQDTAGHWAKDYADFMFQHNMIKGVAAKDGSISFYPQRNLTRAEFAVIMARYLQLNTGIDVELPFQDVDKIPAWALPSVKAVYAQGIMTGSIAANGNATFNPTDNIQRREVMTVIGKALPRGYAVSATSFTDAAKIPAWAAPHIDYLYSLGIVNGYSDGSIGPNNNITRGEIAKLLFGLY